MECLLLGTGAADGWPSPFCTCASCAAAAAAGDVRGQTAALVDDVLLLDCGPEAPRAALRHGRSLAGVRHLLLTHAHPDHTGPAALLWRAWACEASGRTDTLDLVGPPSALEACRDWVGPDDPVRFRAVSPGDRLALGPYDVRVLGAAHPDGAVLYDVADATGARLLYATDTGPLPGATLEAVRGTAYDLVLLEETWGDVTDHGTDHLDLSTFGTQVAALRGAGAVTADTDVVAVHLGHRNPPAPELGRRLAAWGARLVADGTAVYAPPSSPTAPGLTRRTLVLGGARSGKSTEAERLLAAEPSVTYVATSGTRDADPDWQARVAAHRARRPSHWRTVETTDLAPLLREAATPVLVDCLTLWLAAVLDEVGAWDDGNPRAPRDVEADVTRRVDELVTAWRAVRVPVVAVSNEVGSGVHPPTASGRLFRDLMGRLNARVAAESESVLHVVAGRVRPL